MHSDLVRVCMCVFVLVCWYENEFEKKKKEIKKCISRIGIINVHICAER